MNAIKEEQLGMDHAFRTLIEKLQLLKLAFEEKEMNCQSSTLRRK